jgi:hypothetical protein
MIRPFLFRPWLWAAAVLSVATLGCVNHSEIHAESMKLQIEIPPKPFMAGGSMPVRVVFENTGNAAVGVPPILGENLFIYTATDRVRGETTSFGATLREAELSGGSVPPSPDREEVKPKASLAYDDDLGTRLVRPLPPGVYSLKATLPTSAGLVESPPVPFRLEAPKILGATHGVSLDRRFLLSLLAVAESAEAAGIYASYSPPSHPELSLFRRCEKFTVSPTVSSLTLAREVAPSPNWRWAAWIDQQKIGGVLVGPYTARYPFSGRDAGLVDPQILCGLTGPEGTATFVVVGKRGDAAAVNLLHIRSVEEFEVKSTALTLPPDAKPRGFALEAGRVSLVWWEKSQRLMTATIDPVSGGVQQAARQLFQADRPILAWHVAAEEGLAWVILDRDPAKENSAPALVEIDLGQGTVGQEHTLSLPPTGTEGWTIGGIRDGAPLVLARANKQFLQTAPNLGAWKAFGELPGDATSVSLHRVEPGTVWLSFVQPSVGLVFRRLN